MTTVQKMRDILAHVASASSVSLGSGVGSATELIYTLMQALGYEGQLDRTSAAASILRFIVPTPSVNVR